MAIVERVSKALRAFTNHKVTNKQQNLLHEILTGDKIMISKQDYYRLKNTACSANTIA